MSTVPTKPRKRSRPSINIPLERFRDHVDMEQLESFLGNEPEFESFVRAMHDPHYSTLSFPNLCRRFGVSLSRMQQAYTEGMRQIGLIRMSTALPEVMADVAEDAKSKDIPCGRCDGTGIVLGPAGTEPGRPCVYCSGKGITRVAGDKHARDLVFESMKLTGQGGPLVAIQNNTFKGGDENMENMFRLTQAITVGKKEEASAD